jgi:hypothetical protein
MRHPRDGRSVVVGAALAAVAALAVFAASCGPRATPPATAPDAGGGDPKPPAGPPWFEDATAAWGFDFVHDPGPVGNYFTPQSMGSGAAVFDFDGDGLLDIYMLNFGGPTSKSTNRLFRQVSPGKFVEVTAGSGLDIGGFSHGVAIGDVNNDGKPDVLVTQFGGIRLFLNQGGGKFVEVPAAESGLESPMWGMSAAFLDYDRDGWLDLVVVNYLDFNPSQECWSLTGVRDYCGPRHFPKVASKLFRNLGPVAGAPGSPPRVRFQDVSFESGVGRQIGAGLGVVCADFRGPRPAAPSFFLGPSTSKGPWPDIFIANDGEPNRLWVNQTDGTFVDEGNGRGVALNTMGKAYAGMGVAVGDVNNDGMLDLYVTHLGAETNNLWMQGPRGQFRDRTANTGLTATRWRGTGWGTWFADFDNDGWLDLAIANGRVFRGGDARDTGMGYWETYAEKNQLLKNDGTGKFVDASLDTPAFCDYWNVARGLVCADFDNDGGLDVLVCSLGGRSRLFRNVFPARGHWLSIRALDPRLRRDAYGAEVRVAAAGREFFRPISPACSYLCSGPPTAHFGLGPAGRYEFIRVLWPDGLEEVFPGGPADQAVTLVRGEGKPQ